MSPIISDSLDFLPRNVPRLLNMTNSTIPRPRDGLKLFFTRSLSDPSGKGDEEIISPGKRLKSFLNTSLSSRSLPTSPSSNEEIRKRLSALSSVGLINPDELRFRLNSSILVLDTRSFLRFNLNHIAGSINVNCTDRFNRKRLQSGKASLSDLAPTSEGKEILKDKTWSEVVVYDESSESLDSLPQEHPLFVILNALIEDGRKPFILKGGFKDFSISYKSYCENHMMKKSSTINQDQVLLSKIESSSPTTVKDIENYPATEVLPHVYLGNMKDAGDSDFLKEYGVGYVLNLTSKPPPYDADPSIIYKQLRVADNGVQNLLQFFEEAFEFIDEAIKNRMSVLIHCQAGVSRSPTVAVAYLMKVLPLPMSEAYNFVKTRRSIISPNLNFMGQLWEFENKLRRKQGLKRPAVESTESLQDVLRA